MGVKTTAPAKETVAAPTEREYRGFSVESTDAEDGSEILSIKALWLEPEGLGFRRYTPAVGRVEGIAASRVARAADKEEKAVAAEMKTAQQKVIDKITAMPGFLALSAAICEATKDA